LQNNMHRHITPSHPSLIKEQEIWQESGVK